jgi:hypothetical protein
MQEAGCMTTDDFDSDFEEFMAEVDAVDDACEFECRGCDEGAFWKRAPIGMPGFEEARFCFWWSWS